MRQISIMAMIGFFLSVFVGVIGSLASGVFAFGSLLLRGLISAAVVFGLGLVISQVIKLMLPELMSDTALDEKVGNESSAGSGLFHRKGKREQEADVGHNVNVIINDSLSTDANGNSVKDNALGSSYENKNAKATEVFRSQDPALLAQMVRKSMSNDDDD